MEGILRVLPQRLLPGMLVRIHSFREIASTLDENGCCDGLQFMPEMVKFCGQKFKIRQRADKSCMLGGPVRKMVETVVLDGPRCDGSGHDGCQMNCALFWKEAWLSPATPEAEKEGPSTQSAPRPFHFKTRTKTGAYVCQATELQHATKRDLPWWELSQYVVDLHSKTFSLHELPAVMLDLVLGKLTQFRIRRHKSAKMREANSSQDTFSLQTGDLVEVKSYTEIVATLDSSGKYEGLSFAPDMFGYCGGRFRVAARPEKFILETIGRMRPLRNTVYLEGVVCQRHRGCARNMYLMWREAWLRRVADDGN
jgi:hypothetical protein